VSGKQSKQAIPSSKAPILELALFWGN